MSQVQEAVDVAKLHRMVWKFRREIEPYFPTPSPLDSLRFAVTEAAEALDAYLRQNGDYKRNNDKTHSIPQELAQCALMLLTAYPPNVPIAGDFPVFYPSGIDAAVMVVHDAYAHCVTHEQFSQRCCQDAIWVISSYLVHQHGTTLEAELRTAMDRMLDKHMPAGGGFADVPKR